MQISISSTFVDSDAMKLVLDLHDSIRDGTIPNVNLSCIISTRDFGDNALTDGILSNVMDRSSVPVVCVSARQFGRLTAPVSDRKKDTYDQCVMEEIQRRARRLPDVNVMLGDMIVKGPLWCRDLPSLNLHPDLPLSMDGREGIYWDVIGEWVREGREEIGGMMHLAVPTLDAGTPVAYFRLPAKGVVNGVCLGELWEQLPADKDERNFLINEQTALRDASTHPLFQALRRAEADFEPDLVRATVAMLGEGGIYIEGQKIFDKEGHLMEYGLDLTREIVRDSAIWPQVEGGGRNGYEKI